MEYEFKIGDRVRYVSGRHGQRHSNPLWDGAYGKIEGTIDVMADGDKSLFIGVMWDNGRHNSYGPEDLELAGPDPNSICPKCGEIYAVHNDDGSCAEENKCPLLKKIA